MHDIRSGLGDHHIRYVMPQRVAISQGQRGLPDCIDSVKLAKAEIADVVDNVRGKEFIQAIELTVVHQMPVKGYQLVYREAVVSRETHTEVTYAFCIPLSYLSTSFARSAL